MALSKIGSAGLASGAVEAADIADGAITSAKLANPNVFMGRNRIINGDMRIDQRNAGAAVTVDGAAPYTLDRWQAQDSTDGAFTIQQVSTAPVGFVNSLKFTTTTADASLGATQQAWIRQAIEGTSVPDLAWGSADAKTVTLSFWVQSSITGTFGGCVSNSAENRSYPFTYSISSANTWEQKSVTIAGDTSGTWLTTTGVGMRLYFGLGVGSTYSGTAGSWAGATYLTATGAASVIGTLNATWYITGVQLEVGSVATDFERRLYGTELALCQRYFITMLTANLDMQTICTRDGATNAWINLATPVSMRTTPTLGVPSGYGRLILYDTSFNLSVASISSMSIGAVAGQNQYHIVFVIGSTSGSYVFASYDTLGATTPLTLSAEL